MKKLLIALAFLPLSTMAQKKKTVLFLEAYQGIDATFWFVRNKRRISDYYVSASSVQESIFDTLYFKKQPTAMFVKYCSYPEPVKIDMTGHPYKKMYWHIDLRGTLSPDRIDTLPPRNPLRAQ